MGPNVERGDAVGSDPVEETTGLRRLGVLDFNHSPLGVDPSIATMARLA